MELMTVRAAVWEIVRTQAGPMKGAPNTPETKLMAHERTRSQWKPLPLTIFFSGLLRIRLLNEKYIIHENFVYILLNLRNHNIQYFSMEENQKSNILADILLKEDKEKQKKRSWSCQEDAPHREAFSHAKWIDEPPSHIRVGGLDPSRHGELVSVGVLNEVVHHDHQHNGDRNTKVTQGTSHLGKAKKAH